MGLKRMRLAQESDVAVPGHAAGLQAGADPHLSQRLARMSPGLAQQAQIRRLPDGHAAPFTARCGCARGEQGQRLFRAETFIHAQKDARFAFAIDRSLHRRPWIQVPERCVTATGQRNPRIDESTQAIKPGLLLRIDLAPINITARCDETRLRHDADTKLPHLRQQFVRRDARVFDAVTS